MSKEIKVVEIPEEKVMSVFTSEKGLDPYLEQIAKQARSFVPDLSTKKGRDNIASIAYKVRQSKTAMDKAGKALVDKLKEQPKLVDAERKRMREFMDALAEEVRKPLDEFEAKEAARVERHKRMIAHIEGVGNGFIGPEPQSFGLLFSELEKIKVDESFEEFEAEAHRTKEEAKAKLDKMFLEHQAREAEKAELERLRAEAAAREQKEREERIAKEAAERAQREAAEAAAREKAETEAKAKAEREAAERRELELKLAAEKAEREKLEAEERAKRAAIEAEERVKREAEAKAAAEAEETRKREADKKHRAKINNEILSAIKSTGITEDQAKDIVTMIAKGEVPHTKIFY